MYRIKLFFIAFVFAGGFSSYFLSADSWYESPEADMYAHPLLELYHEKENYIFGKIVASTKNKDEKSFVSVKVGSLIGKDKIIEAAIFEDGYVSDKAVNKRVLMSYTGDIASAVVVDSDRRLPLTISGVLFVILVLLVGGFDKIKGLIALFISALFIVFVFIPLVIKGWNPLALAVASVFIITLSTVVAIGRFSRKSISAVIGTLSSVAVVLLLGMVYYSIAHIDGFSLESIQLINYFSKNYLGSSITGFRQIMLGVLIIGSTGMIIDVSVCVASTLEQIAAKDPNIPVKDLSRIGILAGRDMASSTITSLIFAYFGAELIPLIANTLFIDSVVHLFNNEWFFIAVFQAFAGAIGILLAVPFTSAVSARLLKHSFRAKSGH